MALLGFDTGTGTDEIGAWRSVFQDIVSDELKTYPAWQLLPRESVQFALRQLEPGEPPSLTTNQALQVCRILGAKAVVSGEISQIGNGFLLDATIVETTQVKHLVVTSGNCSDLARRFVRGFLGALGTGPRDSGSALAKGRWSTSVAALQYYGAAVEARDKGSQAKAEGLCSQAITNDSEFAAAYDLYAELLRSRGMAGQAVAAAEKAVRSSPSDSTSHKILGSCLWVAKRFDQAEDELRKSAVLYPDDGEVYAALGYLATVKNRQAQAKAAYIRALDLSPYGSFAASAHATLGFLYAVDGRPAEALAQLEVGRDTGSPRDDLVSQYLCLGYMRLNLFHLAKEHCNNFLECAKQRRSSALEINSAEQLCSNVEARLRPTYFNLQRPKAISATGLLERAHQTVTLADVELIRNPFETNAEMTNWAQHATASSTTELAKARQLFEVLMYHQNKSAVSRQPFGLTAAEVFSKWNDPDSQLQCRERTFIFVALARCLGIGAYAVSVEETFDGSTALHGCAAVYIGEQAALVDLQFGWFGAPHKRFTVLDDTQAAAIYLCSFPEVRRCRVAAKIAPELYLVQFSLCWQLLESGFRSEAEDVLPKVAALGGDRSLTEALLGLSAIEQRRFEIAISHLKEAVERDPAEGDFHLSLARAYKSVGRMAQACACYKNALNCQLTEDSAAQTRRELIECSNGDRNLSRTDGNQ